MFNVLPGEGRKCGPPPDIENGDILSFQLKQYPQGATLKYKCARFYILKGPEQITCTDGQWTNPPVCLGRWKLVLRGQELCELLVVFFSGPAGASLVKQHLCWGCDADRAEQQLVLLLCRRNFLWRSARVAASAACCPSLPPVTNRSRRRGVWLSRFFGAAPPVWRAPELGTLLRSAGCEEGGWVGVSARKSRATRKRI